MKILLAILVLTVTAWAQSSPQTAAPLQAAGAASSAGSNSASSGGGSSASGGAAKSGTYSNESGGIEVGNSTTFSDIPSDKKKEKKVVVPSSLLGASADPD